jgi:hypothetical protein
MSAPAVTETVMQTRELCIDLCGFAVQVLCGGGFSQSLQAIT